MEFDQEAARREKVKLLRQDKIDRYDRNVPIWLGNLKDLFLDPVWEGELERYALKWFGKSEGEMRSFLGLDFVPTPKVLAKIEASVPERKKAIEALNKKALTPAERSRLYRARKAGK